MRERRKGKVRERKGERERERERQRESTYQCSRSTRGTIINVAPEGWRDISKRNWLSAEIRRKEREQGMRKKN